MVEITALLEFTGVEKPEALDELAEVEPMPEDEERKAEDERTVVELDSVD